MSPKQVFHHNDGAFELETDLTYDLYTLEDIVFSDIVDKDELREVALEWYRFFQSIHSKELILLYYGISDDVSDDYVQALAFGINMMCVFCRLFFNLEVN